jgi:hypothetical protein
MFPMLQGAIEVMIVWLVFQLAVLSMPITTEVVSSNLGKLLFYSIWFGLVYDAYQLLTIFQLYRGGQF